MQTIRIKLIGAKRETIAAAVRHLKERLGRAINLEDYGEHQEFWKFGQWKREGWLTLGEAAALPGAQQSLAARGRETGSGAAADYEQGRADGYLAGYAAGRTNGYAEGMAKGYAEGRARGYADACAEQHTRTNHAREVGRSHILPGIAYITEAEASAIRRAIARLHHPDARGNVERMKTWNVALDETRSW